MARPRTQPNAPSTRSKILNAARIEFSTQGIAAPLDAIAKRCGIATMHRPCRPLSVC